MIPIIVDNDLKADTIQELVPTAKIGIENISLPASDGPATIGEPVAGVIGIGVTKPSAPAIDATEPISNPEHEPEFPGGVKALRKFLERNLTNPTEMTEGEMVAVHVKFVVGYDGKLQKFTVIKDGGVIFNNEVIRVLKKMPQWIPGKSNGKNVAVYFTIPIKFVSAD